MKASHTSPETILPASSASWPPGSLPTLFPPDSLSYCYSARGSGFIISSGLCLRNPLAWQSHFHSRAQWSEGKRSKTCVYLCVSWINTQGSNSQPLQWSAESQPLDWQGNPRSGFVNWMNYIIKKFEDYGSKHPLCLTIPFQPNSTWSRK